MNDVAGDLRAARALIDTPEKWRRLRSFFEPVFQVAVDANGTYIPARGVSAMSALKSAMQSVPSSRATLHGYAKSRVTTHADIMALFDRAISQSEGNT
jgi:hypothetical protein